MPSKPSTENIPDSPRFTFVGVGPISKPESQISPSIFSPEQINTPFFPSPTSPFPQQVPIPVTPKLPSLQETEDYILVKTVKVFHKYQEKWIDKSARTTLSIIRDKIKNSHRIYGLDNQAVLINLLVTPDLQIKNYNETAIQWQANDYTHGQPRLIHFGVRFNSAEEKREFMAIFTNIVRSMTTPLKVVPPPSPFNQPQPQAPFNQPLPQAPFNQPQPQAQIVQAPISVEKQPPPPAAEKPKLSQSMSKLSMSSDEIDEDDPKYIELLMSKIPTVVKKAVQFHETDNALEKRLLQQLNQKF